MRFQYAVGVYRRGLDVSRSRRRPGSGASLEVAVPIPDGFRYWVVPDEISSIDSFPWGRVWS